MAGFAPVAPLAQDSGDGYLLLKNFKNLIKQNFKMLILTVPGERVMEPNFGVGIKKYLFNNFNQQTYTEIDSKIRQQTAIYMPLITILEIRFGTADRDMNLLGVSIRYAIPRIGATDLLEFTI
mgnify:CR=1 FL=1|tara:strand:- start:321 stop:689 length:369 start_codon:yes stop_codon:yes gene_type:complete